MSYYIIPKINNILNVNPQNCDNNITPHISYSLYKYYKELLQEIKNHLKNTDTSYNEFIQIVNPYEYIFSRVPGSNFSVSKLRPKTNLFYDFLEISITLNIFESYKNMSIKTLHITNNNNDSIECFEMLRENYEDEIIFYDEFNDNTINLIGDINFDFLFFEAIITDTNNYIISLINYIMVILRNQSLGGTCVIKIDNIFYKPIIDIIYILSSLYEKIYILKPNTSNITTFDKYIICKKFQFNNESNNESNKYLKLNFYKLLIFLKKLENKNIKSILDFNIPNYFITKLQDLNIIIGQQQIDSLELILNILKNKNKEEKIEMIKKSNIQKSVLWCEKYKIPFNKFTEKINIFLPITKELKINENNET
jgi:hypothetical protein